MKSAYTKNAELAAILINRTGVNVPLADADTLRRAELTLRRWAELECGDGDNYKSWAIERDEKTDKPYMVTYPHDGKARRHAIPDREKGALRRIAKLCAELGLHYFHQTDPRGCSLYVSNEPLTDTDYSRGVACCGRD